MTDKKKELILRETARIVVRSYFRRQSRVFNSHHKDDLYQVVFLTLWKCHIRGTIDWNNNYDAWLKKRAKGAILDYLASCIPCGYGKQTCQDAPKTSYFAHGEDRAELFLPESLTTQNDDIKRFDDMDNFEHLISPLSPSRKKLVRLKFVEDADGDEIGKHFNISKSRVSHRLKETIAELKTKAEIYD